MINGKENVIKLLMSQSGMTRQEAEEYIDSHQERLREYVMKRFSDDIGVHVQAIHNPRAIEEVGDGIVVLNMPKVVELLDEEALSGLVAILKEIEYVQSQEEKEEHVEAALSSAVEAINATLNYTEKMKHELYRATNGYIPPIVDKQFKEVLSRLQSVKESVKKCQ